MSGLTEYVCPKCHFEFEAIDTPFRCPNCEFDWPVSKLDALRAHNAELEEKLTFVMTSMEVGSLPWWQNKHDELALKVVNYAIDKSELTDALKKAREAMEQLRDHQNGCPLPKYADGWTNAMNLTRDALTTINKVLGDG